MSWLFDESKAFKPLQLAREETVRGAYSAELGTGMAKTTVKMVITSHHLHLNPLDQSGFKTTATALGKIPGLAVFEVAPILLGYGLQEPIKIPLHDIAMMEPFNEKGLTLPGIKIRLRDGSTLELSIMHTIPAWRGSNRNVVARDEAFRVLQNAATLEASTSALVSSGDIPDQIRKLGELRDAGWITGEEFETKKTELLSRI